MKGYLKKKKSLAYHCTVLPTAITLLPVLCDYSAPYQLT